jgi:hypothetical protein
MVCGTIATVTMGLEIVINTIVLGRLVQRECEA